MIELRNRIYRVERAYVQQFPDSTIEPVEFKDIGIGNIFPLDCGHGLQIIAPNYYRLSNGRQVAAGFERTTVSWHEIDRPIVTVETLLNNHTLRGFTQFQSGDEYYGCIPITEYGCNMGEQWTNPGIPIGYKIKDVYCEFDHETQNVFICVDYDTFVLVVNDKGNAPNGHIEPFSHSTYELLAEVHRP